VYQPSNVCPSLEGTGSFSYFMPYVKLIDSISQDPPTGSNEILNIRFHFAYKVTSLFVPSSIDSTLDSFPSSTLKPTATTKQKPFLLFLSSFF